MPFWFNNTLNFIIKIYLITHSFAWVGQDTSDRGSIDHLLYHSGLTFWFGWDWLFLHIWASFGDGTLTLHLWKFLSGVLLGLYDIFFQWWDCYLKWIEIISVLRSGVAFIPKLIRGILIILSILKLIVLKNEVGNEENLQQEGERSRSENLTRLLICS